MGEGVEWALHCCVDLALGGAGRAVPAARLAAYHDLPPVYFNKQLQALARAGIVVSVPGPRGGFRLARPPEQITFMDVVVAIEGPDPAFRCAEIRRRGPGAGDPAADPGPCLIDEAMRGAELAWRSALAARTVADIAGAVRERAPDVPERIRGWLAASRT
ncbi:BadM/Rrf2 family transcriptional regulator [Pseudonocardia kunmingensis]|uniref:BadM/Rrf2 family transcriptional regulator n=2 Tax=Pseudonocardia kunmingensis TaxID=630975 RepID=A0A543DNQ5_9PSEU|nr:BadM/Rrf2 family transcriptional regulator [Pseudonocardia kunmingensis]